MTGKKNTHESDFVVAKRDKKKIDLNPLVESVEIRVSISSHHILVATIRPCCLASNAYDIRTA